MIIIYHFFYPGKAVYEKGKTYSTEMGRVHYCNLEYIVEEGFHSFSKLDWNVLSNNCFIKVDGYGRHFTFPKNEYTVVMECVIPKDSLYYENSIGLIVSDSIKFVREMSLE